MEHAGRGERGRLHWGDGEASFQPFGRLSIIPDVPSLFLTPLLCPLDLLQRFTHTHAQVPIKGFSTYREPSILIHRMGNEIRKSSLRSMTGENTKALELSWT